MPGREKSGALQGSPKRNRIHHEQPMARRNWRDPGRLLGSPDDHVRIVGRPGSHGQRCREEPGRVTVHPGGDFLPGAGGGGLSGPRGAPSGIAPVRLEPGMDPVPSTGSGGKPKASHGSGFEREPDSRVPLRNPLRNGGLRIQKVHQREAQLVPKGEGNHHRPGVEEVGVHQHEAAVAALLRLPGKDVNGRVRETDPLQLRATMETGMLHQQAVQGRQLAKNAGCWLARILAAGHVSVDFVIVASGPNGASPHHEVSDRVIEVGDPVVVDIGGSMPDGYCSDSTRTYSVGEPVAVYREWFEVLERAQQASCAAIAPGVACEAIDEAGRAVLRDAGLGDLFIHRTGHGIGLETHEEPYIVKANALQVEPGMAFSIEPGFYETGRFGARIEDIVICTETGFESVNSRPRGLAMVEVA